VREGVVRRLAFFPQAACTGMHGMAPKRPGARGHAWTQQKSPLSNQARNPLYAHVGCCDLLDLSKNLSFF
jgi:hypothetical protein